MKYQFPPEFEKLTQDQIKQVNAWLDEFPYRLVHQKLQESFAIAISDNKLCRYNQHRELADDFEFETKVIYQLLNAEPVPFDEAALKVLEQRTFEQVLKPDLTVGKIVALHKLASYKQRLSLDQRRLAITETRLKIASVTFPASTRAPKPVPTASESPTAPSIAPAVPSPPGGSVPASIQPSPQPTNVSPAAPPQVHAKARPAQPAMSPNEWTSLISGPPVANPGPGTNTAKYSPAFSHADRLLSSNIVVLPAPWKDSLVPALAASPRDAKKLIHLARHLPSEPIPFPCACSSQLPFAA